MDFVIVWLVCAGIAAAIAGAKGRGTGNWFVLGCIFGIFAVIVVALLSSIKPPTVIAGGEIATEKTHVRCPDCRELVRNDARKCKHCGVALTPVGESY